MLRAMNDDAGKSEKAAPPERVTLADVKASLNPNVREQFFVIWFGRPAGNLLTPFFYNTGWSANAVTGLRFCFTLAAFAGLIWSSAESLIAAAVLFYVNYVLDQVDGNIARLKGTVTYWGKFIDGIGDRFFYIFAPFAAGLGLWRTTELGGWPVAVGAAIAAATLYADMLNDRLSHFREWLTREGGPPGEAEEARAAKAAGTIAWSTRSLTNAGLLLPLMWLVPGGLYWYLLALVPLQGIAAFVRSLALMRQAGAVLRRSRKSRKGL